MSTRTKARSPLARFWVSPGKSGRTRLALLVLLLVRISPYLLTAWPFRHGLAEGVFFYREHLTFGLFLLSVWVTSWGYLWHNHRRLHPPMRRSRGSRTPKPTRPVQPPLPSLSQTRRDAADILANHEPLPLRLIYLVAAAASVYVTMRFPVSVDTLTSLRDQTDNLRGVLISAAAPVALIAFLYFRISHIVGQRGTIIDEIYAIARDTLKYPKSLPKTNPTGRQVMLTTPWKAVAVSDWSSLYEPNRLFVLAPEELSIDDVQKWDDFGVNLNAKRPRDEEWRVERDPRGRGAQVGPANYPTAILWDGEHDADPLTFYLGLNLETGQRQTLTLNDASPHVACSGGTSSGKLIDLSTVLPAPSGWRQVGEIKVGDAIFDEAGQPVKVTAMSPVVTNPDAYRVTFHDGTTVDADGGHLWTTWDRSARRARSRQVCTVRARYPWLSDAQRALLSAELETTVHGEDVSVQQVIRLLGAESIWDRPFYETARTIGVCRSRQQNTTFVYADQVVEQRQTCTVIDRADGLALAEYMAGSASQRVKAASLVVRMMAAAEGGSVLTAPQLASATGMDRASVIGVLGRANVESLRKEQVTVALVVPAKTVTRVGMKVDHFYPKKAYLEALIERGLQPKNDQRHLMSMPKVRTTREIADTLRYCSAGAEEDAHSWANHSIPRAGAAQYPARVLPLDPYVMGAWLGDGTSNGGGFTSIDPEIWEQIEAAGFDVHHGSVPKAHYIRGLTKPLRAAGVLSNKHIPENYLLGSVEQRLALLQGLMDTDGSVNRTSGTCEFYQSDEALARQVRSLVASLGMIAHLRSKPGGYRTPGGTWVPCKQAWTVSFAPTMPVFRLARKMALIDPEAVRAKSEHRYIVAVDPIEPVPMRCLMVDSDTHQFLVTDQYVPTHNTSAAEIIAAQVLIKAMPWDPDLYGMVVIVDPKGPFARRWAGRPGVVVANGQMDSAEPDEDGNPITGPTVMANCMAWLEAEHIRRANVMARYADVATWVHLPDEVKRAERFCPILVVLDEYIDHTDIEKAHGDERVERENEARIATARMASWHARKYRNVGMHTFLIAQRVNMSIIGNTLMSNLPVRIITGQMDRSQTETMFGTSEVPSLPATRTVVESGERRVKTIPGRARIMNALGQAIHKVQVMWFGGATNSDTLDKWLPRGEVPVNGDFDPPTGKPRTRADFDADGNLITADSPAPPGLVSITADEPGEGDSDGDGVPDGLDLGTPDEVADPTEQEVTFGPDARPGLDPSAVFPAAQATLPDCGFTGCVNEASSACTGCSGPFCGYHLKGSPDPEQKGWFCATCITEHPLSTSGAAALYTTIWNESREVGLTARLVVQAPDAVVVTVLTAGDKGRKVLELRADAGDLSVQSRAGVRTGDEVTARVEEIMSAYREKQSAAAAAGADAGPSDEPPADSADDGDDAHVPSEEIR